MGSRGEMTLKLRDDEAIDFGLYDATYVKHMLNAKSTAPCALHAWGSQLSECPCGCRSSWLSIHRLETKGLFGCLVRSEFESHLHPNEAMALNGMDPTIDFGLDVKLSLSACGQISSPIQVVWILGALATHLRSHRQGHVKFDQHARLLAFRTWLFAKCQLAWPNDGKHITLHHANFVQLVELWH